MSDFHSRVRTLYWHDDALMLLDQRRLPAEQAYVRCATSSAVADAIKSMVVRGAPAIGIAAAYGVVLAARAAWAKDNENWREIVQPALEQLLASRPTAINLHWAVQSMVNAFSRAGATPVDSLLAHATQLHHDDVANNQAMARHGAQYLERGSAVLTHCNAGALATAGYGTALGVIRTGWDLGLLDEVYATETRPWLQGARLTAWELHEDNIPVTLIADSAAAQLLAGGKVRWVITGADRVAANGDVANKIGTYTLALCARALGVRFMVAAPTSTIDIEVPDGRSIPIEERDWEEIFGYLNTRVAPPGIRAINPVFDVTPSSLIDVLVTEKGAIEKPDRSAIEQHLRD